MTIYIRDLSEAAVIFALVERYWKCKGLDTRTANALLNAGYYRVDQVKKLSDGELLNISGVGKAGSKQIKTVLPDWKWPKDLSRVSTTQLIDELRGRRADNLQDPHCGVVAGPRNDPL